MFTPIQSHLSFINSGFKQINIGLFLFVLIQSARETCFLVALCGGANDV
jgi:hypothetical protein